MSAIEVSALQKSYGQLRAVDEISFSVNQGEVFSLLGPNGAGKTTTIEILEGIRQRDGGNVRVLGVDPWTSGYALHKKLGIIPQGFTFFPKAKPKEAIQYYADLFGVTVDSSEILRKVVLDDAVNTYFEDLSGGQKQKVGLALSLVNNPEMLFLDEPTTGLDPQARRAVWEVIRELKKEGRSIMLTTHYLEEAEVLADRVAIMNKGKIAAIGTPAEIIAQHGSGERLEFRGDQKLADYLREHTNLDVGLDGNNLVRVRIGEKHDILVALESMERSGLDWADLKTRKDSLEDVFIKLVGFAIEEGGGIKQIGNSGRGA
ncbi:ABC transporter ATP-binding protein [Candidatus Bathyarchaeota archaeon]|nr:MAG: ABC transporter ATP-binding protein [Candidatus Bathyarchaeota archaeon]TMI68145.1 MAG: ABC transporter ATP-binding protein [Candidatus Bathyarchaeota archaeon]